MNRPVAALPSSLRANPELASWLRFVPEGNVEISTGKVELGQGILTALAQIAADELDVPIGRVRLAATETAHAPNEGVTAGSHSIEHSGMALRQACAEARALFAAAAAARLGMPVAELVVEDGVFVGPGNLGISYWELADVVSLARPATGEARPKPRGARRLVGGGTARIDIPGKVFGRPSFIHDLRPPGMLHGRVIRSTAPGARPGAVDEAALRSVPGFVRLVRDGNFLGVIAESEPALDAAVARLERSIGWSDGEPLPDADRLNDWLASARAETTVPAARDADGPEVVRTLRRRYSRPYLAHASIAPSCALAHWSEDGVRVWSHSQGIFNLRAEIATVCRLPLERVVVEHVQGAGCYGHNGADDAALDAAMLARAADGRPLRVQWTRENELSRAPFGAAMLVEIEAGLDAFGAVRTWRHSIWSNGHTLRPGRGAGPTLLAAGEIAEPFERQVAVNPPLAGGGGADRNAVPLYDIPAFEIVSHRLLEMPLRTSSMRSLGGFANVFAIESFVDELAEELGEDPLALRLRYLRDARGRAVLEAAARLGGWGGRRLGEGCGRGLAFARYKNASAYCAVVAEVDCTEEVRVAHLAVAVDVGEAINPDGVVNQIEGGAIQAASWATREAVTFDRARVTSAGWEGYPILRFSEVPRVEVEIVPRPDDPPLGAGEAAQGPVAAAIGNAVRDALGLRVRNLPITREKIIGILSGED